MCLSVFMLFSNVLFYLKVANKDNLSPYTWYEITFCHMLFIKRSVWSGIAFVSIPLTWVGNAALIARVRLLTACHLYADIVLMWACRWRWHYELWLYIRSRSAALCSINAMRLHRHRRYCAHSSSTKIQSWCGMQSKIKQKLTWTQVTATSAHKTLLLSTIFQIILSAIFVACSNIVHSVY